MKINIILAKQWYQRKNTQQFCIFMCIFFKHDADKFVHDRDIHIYEEKILNTKYKTYEKILD